MYASMQLAGAYDSMYACSTSMEASEQYHVTCKHAMQAAVEVTSRSMEYAYQVSALVAEIRIADTHTLTQTNKLLYATCLHT